MAAHKQTGHVKWVGDSVGSVQLQTPLLTSQSSGVLLSVERRVDQQGGGFGVGNNVMGVLTVHWLTNRKDGWTSLRENRTLYTAQQ